MKKKLLWVGLIGSLLTLQANASQLQQIQQKIERLAHALSQDQHQQNHIQKQLQQVETQRGAISVALNNTQQQLTTQQKKLQQLTAQQHRYEQQWQAQQTTIGEQLRAFYILGQPSYAKLWLNPDGFTQRNRTMMYYHYLQQQRLTLLEKLNTTLTQVDDSKIAVQQQTQKLTTTKQQQQQQNQQLQKNQQQRQQLLQSVNQNISNKQQQLQILIADKAALEKIIQHFSSHPLRQVFAKHTGRFPWPTQGKIIQSFNAPIEQSELKSNGVLIRAPQGQPVYAVAPGQVVYANWMAGYGLLLIIDHGNGFMSIYGRNHSVYKKTGDTIHRGDLIATVGNSGGFDQSALYFGLRQAGKPINPQQWCG